MEPFNSASTKATKWVGDLNLLYSDFLVSRCNHGAIVQKEKPVQNVQIFNSYFG